MLYREYCKTHIGYVVFGGTRSINTSSSDRDLDAHARTDECPNAQLVRCRTKMITNITPFGEQRIELISIRVRFFG